MPDAYTSGKLGLIEPQAGGYSGTWDQPLFANWQTIDAALSGQTILTLSSSDVTLTIPKFPASTNPPSVATSAQNLNIVLLGTLTANVFVNLPANTPGMWIVYNGTTSPGNFNVSIRSATPGSNSIVMPRGYNSFIQSNGANVAWADGGNVAANASIPVATDTVNGIVKQGLLSGNCVNLNSAGKIPYQTDKYIISTSDPDPAQGDQNWLWFKVV